MTLPSAGVWRIAFWIRLKRTRWTFSASALATRAPAGSSAARLDAALLGGGAHRGDGLADQLAELDLAHRPGDVSGLDPGELEEIVDQVAEDGDVGADLRQVAVARLTGRDAVVDRLDQQPQRGERRAQVVRGGGDELRRASSMSRLERSSIASRTASAVARAAAPRGDHHEKDLGRPPSGGDRYRGGAGEEGGDRDRRAVRALHGRNL